MVRPGIAGFVTLEAPAGSMTRRGGHTTDIGFRRLAFGFLSHVAKLRQGRRGSVGQQCYRIRTALSDALIRQWHPGERR